MAQEMTTAEAEAQLYYLKGLLSKLDGEKLEQFNSALQSMREFMAAHGDMAQLALSVASLEIVAGDKGKGIF